MTPIPYKGGADARTDLIGGRISAMFPDIASALPQIRGGKLRALAVASDKRVAALPELPTLGESGYPGFEAWAWQGFVAPAGTPRAVVMKLNAEFARDRKSTRLNSSHLVISYAVFCLKKKKIHHENVCA